MSDPFDLGPPRSHHSLVRSFELTLVLVIVAEYWWRGIPRWGQLGPHYYWLIAIATASGACVVFGRLRRPALAVLGLNHAVLVWYEFPSAGNHAYLESALCLIGAWLRLDDPREVTLYQQSVRWLTAMIFFYSGLQKLVHGFWRHGEFFAYTLATAEPFRNAVAPFVSADDLQRLLAYNEQPGDGPYRLLSSPILLGVSHTVWALEMATAPLVLFTRTRVIGVLLATALVFAIEVGAREFGFGLVYLAMIVACLDTDLSRRLLPVFTCVLVLLLLERVHVLPEFTFY